MIHCKNCGSLTIIMDVCADCGSKLEIEPPKNKVTRPSIYDMTLRDYQQEAVDITLASDNKVCILTNSMRSGKSLYIAKLALEYEKQGYVVLIMFNISALVDQFGDLIPDSHIIKDKKERSGSKDIYISMEQTLYARIDKHKFDKPVVILRDEIGGIVGERMNKFRTTYNIHKEVITSATPYDERAIKIFPNAHYINTISNKELVERGFRVIPKYYVPSWTRDIKFDEVKKTGNDYNTDQMESLMTDEWYKTSFMKWIRTICLDKRYTLIYCLNIAHAEFIESILSEFKHLGIGIVHSKRKTSENEADIEAFNNGSKRILISVTSLLVGFDSPRANTLISLRNSLVKRLVFQLLLRANTSAEGKTHADIFDLGNNLMTHGFPDQDPQFDGYKDIDERNKNKKKEGLKSIEQLIKDSNGDIEISAQIIKKFENKVDYYRSKKYSELTKKECDILLDSASNLEDVLLYSAWLYNKTYDKVIVKKFNYEWVMNYVVSESNKIVEYDKLVRYYKKRAKTIIKEKKKYAALKFYIDWLINESYIDFTKIDIRKDEEIDF